MTLKKLSYIEIKRVLEESVNFIPSFKGIEFDDCSIFNDPQFKFPYLVFKDCIFKTRFILQNKVIPEGVFIKGCTFTEGIYISKVKSLEINHYFPNKGRSFCIQESSILKQFSIYRCEFKSIYINLQNEELKINITKTIAIEDIILENTKIDELILKDSYTDSIRLNSIECSSLLWTANAYRAAHIIKSTFQLDPYSNIISERKDIPNLLISFLGCNIQRSYFFIWTVNPKTYVSFRNNNFKNACSIIVAKEREKNEIKLFFENNTSDNVFRLESVNNFRTKLEKLKVSFDSNSNGTFLFRSFDVRFLDVMGNVNRNHVSIDEIKILESCIFHQFTNKSVFKFSNISSSPNASLIMENVDLGEMNVFNLDFSQFRTIFFEHAQLSQVDFNSVSWFTENQLKLSNTQPETLEWEKRKVSLYRQLKRASEKSNNLHQASVFRSYEEKAYFKSTRFTHSVLNRERILMSLKQTNDFGLNWIRPIKLAIIINLVFYFLLVFASLDFQSSVISIEFWCHCLTNLKNNIVLYPQLFNPTHSFKELSESTGNYIEQHFLSSFLDVIQRVIMTFLIFQTIVAFRKQVG